MPAILDLPPDPARVMRAWPPDQPLASLWSAGDAPAARWTILARPRGVEPPAGVDRLLRRRLAVAPAEQTGSHPPFAGGWIALLAYDLGREFEPRASAALGGAVDDRGWPSQRWLNCPDALAFDHAASTWHLVGDPGPTASILSILGLALLGERTPGAYRCGPATSATGRERYERGVARVLGYLRAGDCYQVNLAHRLIAPFEGSPRALFLDLATRARPWMGAYAEWDDGPTRRGVASVSPEEFLVLGPGAQVRTRPMKGTRPDAPGMERDLLKSPKDRAELAMIVDLMRNDLGRVCELGSVRVVEPRRLERHAGGGVIQATAEVFGERRPDLTMLDLLGATFPGGSVTGAPKIRAMQIIDELEPVRRGLYCGGVGYLSACGRAAFNIAIRTATMQGEPGAGDRIHGVLDYGVGAGIVAESDPAAEWRETLAKARPLAGVAPLQVR